MRAFPPLHPRLLLILLPALLAAAGCKSGPRTSPTSYAHAGEILALNRELEERFRAGDMLGMADVYADDGLLIARNTRIEGREAIDAYWEDFTEPIDCHLEVFEIGGAEGLLYERGRRHLTRMEDGIELTTGVEFLLIWKLDAQGEWKIAVDSYW